MLSFPQGHDGWEEEETSVDPVSPFVQQIFTLCYSVQGLVLGTEWGTKVIPLQAPPSRNDTGARI